ncbi:MAG: hypothetical protein K5883_06830 [Pseudobutyrivibrio sp.]|nr:hypothetical protein [Pseudobutyrivibrio sp.]
MEEPVGELLTPEKTLDTTKETTTIKDDKVAKAGKSAEEIRKEQIERNNKQ